MNDIIRLPGLNPMKKILILDDNFDILVLYKTLVSHMGLSVRLRPRMPSRRSTGWTRNVSISS